MNKIQRITKSRFHHFGSHHENPFIDFLYNERLRQILNMIYAEIGEKSTPYVLLDIGCGQGYFSRVLSLAFKTVGLDIEKNLRGGSQAKSKNLNFIIADMNAMPFRSHSFDIIIGASVVEHCKNLKDLLEKIKHVLRKSGVFIIGYPVETRFFKFIWKRISPLSSTYMNQNQIYWCNPSTGKQDCYWENPYTHKQDYKKIRDALAKHFRVVKRKKLPFNILPDSLAFYEVAKVIL